MRWKRAVSTWCRRRFPPAELSRPAPSWPGQGGQSFHKNGRRTHVIPKPSSFERTIDRKPKRASSPIYFALNSLSSPYFFYTFILVGRTRSSDPCIMQTHHLHSLNNNNIVWAVLGLFKTNGATMGAPLLGYDTLWRSCMASGSNNTNIILFTEKARGVIQEDYDKLW